MTVRAQQTRIIQFRKMRQGSLNLPISTFPHAAAYSCYGAFALGRWTGQMHLNDTLLKFPIRIQVG